MKQFPWEVLRDALQPARRRSRKDLVRVLDSWKRGWSWLRRRLLGDWLEGWFARPKTGPPPTAPLGLIRTRRPTPSPYRAWLSRLEGRGAGSPEDVARILGLSGEDGRGPHSTFPAALARQWLSTHPARRGVYLLEGRAAPAWEVTGLEDGGKEEIPELVLLRWGPAGTADLADDA